jgi:hypothetical protein
MLKCDKVELGDWPLGACRPRRRFPFRTVNQRLHQPMTGLPIQ